MLDLLVGRVRHDAAAGGPALVGADGEKIATEKQARCRQIQANILKSREKSHATRTSDGRQEQGA